MPPVPGSNRSSRTSAGRCRLTRPARLVRVAAQDRRIAGFGERVLDVAQHLGVVIHHEDACLTRSPGRSGGAMGSPALPSQASSATGIGEREPGAVPEPGALGPDAAPVRFHQPLADGKTEAESAHAALGAGDIGVLPEQVRQLLGRHAPPFVGDRDGDVDAVPQRANVNRG